MFLWNNTKSKSYVHNEDNSFALRRYKEVNMQWITIAIAILTAVGEIMKDD